MKLIRRYSFFLPLIRELELWALYLLSKQSFKYFGKEQPQECWYQFFSIIYSHSHFLSASLYVMWRSTAWMRQNVTIPSYSKIIKKKKKESAETRKFAAFERMPLNDLRIVRLILWLQCNSKMNWSRKLNVNFIRTVEIIFRWNVLFHSECT